MQPKHTQFIKCVHTYMWGTTTKKKKRKENLCSFKYNLIERNCVSFLFLIYFHCDVITIKWTFKIRNERNELKTRGWFLSGCLWNVYCQSINGLKVLSVLNFLDDDGNNKWPQTKHFIIKSYHLSKHKKMICVFTLKSFAK